MSEIISKYPPYITVRAELDSELFRPAATGLSVDNTFDRMEMELRETIHIPRDTSYLGCSASMSKESSIKGAYFEAIEKVSVAKWWAYQLPIIAREKKLDDSLASYNLESIEFEIPSITGAGICIASIIKNNTYPYFVLGSGFSINRKLSQEKARSEAINSLVGTEWYISNGKQGPGWDFGELSKRWQEVESYYEINSHEDCQVNEDEIIDKAKYFFKDSSLFTTQESSIYISWISSGQNQNSRNFEIAKHYSDSDLQIKIFTEPNW